MVCLNLIPSPILAAQVRRRHLRRWAIAIAVAGLGVALPLAADALQYNKLRSLRSENATLQTELQQVFSELRLVTSEAARAQVQIEHADALRAKRAWSGILATIGSQLPPACWLTSLATDPPAPSGAGVSTPKPGTGENPAGGVKPTVVVLDAPRKLRLAGYSPDSALPHTFVKSLKETNLFVSVRLDRSVREPTAEGEFYRFELECEW